MFFLSCTITEGGAYDDRSKGRPRLRVVMRFCYRFLNRKVVYTKLSKSKVIYFTHFLRDKDALVSYPFFNSWQDKVSMLLIFIMTSNSKKKRKRKKNLWSWIDGNLDESVSRFFLFYSVRYFRKSILFGTCEILSLDTSHCKNIFTNYITFESTDFLTTQFTYIELLIKDYTI